MRDNWQNVRADQYRVYPEKSEAWHEGYVVGCHDAGVAGPSDPVPDNVLWHPEKRAGFHQGFFDVAVRRP